MCWYSRTTRYTAPIDEPGGISSDICGRAKLQRIADTCKFEKSRPFCWIPRRYKRALTGTANGGRHKAMPCLAEEVLKAPVGQPAFQQLKGAAALYCQHRKVGPPCAPMRIALAVVAGCIAQMIFYAERFQL